MYNQFIAARKYVNVGPAKDFLIDGRRSTI